MNGQQIVNRTIRCDNRRSCGDRVTIRCLDARAITVFNFHNASPGEDVSATLDNRSRKSIQVFQRMKLRLAGKAQYSLGIKLANWNAINALHAKTSADGSVKFAPQLRNRAARWQKQVTGEPLEITLNFLFRDDRFDAINRSRVAVCAETRALLAQDFLDFVVTIVQRADEMGSGSPSHSAADRTIIDQDNVSIFTGE